jgi:hypothetical protein
MGGKVVCSGKHRNVRLTILHPSLGSLRKGLEGWVCVGYSVEHLDVWLLPSKHLFVGPVALRRLALLWAYEHKGGMILEGALKEALVFFCCNPTVQTFVGNISGYDGIGKVALCFV